MKTNPIYNTLKEVNQDDEKIIQSALKILEDRITYGDVLNSPDDTKKYILLKLSRKENEVFTAIFLNTRHRVIAFEEMFNGTINMASVHPREIVKRALYHNASAIIYAHNHPSGDPEPSQADRNLTEQLQKALALIEVRTLDHFVVGTSDVVSFAERGWI